MNEEQAQPEKKSRFAGLKQMGENINKRLQPYQKEERATESSKKFQSMRQREVEKAVMERERRRIKAQYGLVKGKSKDKGIGGFNIFNEMGASALAEFDPPKAATTSAKKGEKKSIPAQPMAFGMNPNPDMSHLKSLIGEDIGWGTPQKKRK